MKIFILACAVLLFDERAATREAFLQLISKPQVALAPVAQGSRVVDGLVHEQVSFSAEAGIEPVPALIVRPRTQAGRRPAVIVLHGTGGTKERMIPWLDALARRGFVAIAIDGRHHGRRTKSGKGAEEYVAAILQAHRDGRGHPFLYDTVWDVLRTLDYLETRADIDTARIGLTGTSKGGMEAYLAAAIDTRIAAVAPLIGVQSFRWALQNDAWQSRVSTFQSAVDAVARETGAPLDAALVRKFYDRVVPGIYDRFDGPAMLPLIAPRPLLVVNGDSDPRTPVEGVRECAVAAERAYAAAGARDRFELYLQPQTAHRVTDEAQKRTIEWFVRWLKP